MNIEETRDEIISRTEKIVKKRRQRLQRGLKASLAVLTIILIVVIQYLPIAGTTGEISGNYATLVLGTEIGAYIIVGIVCFLIGMVVTLIAVKTRDNNNNN